ncbi:hypothetical protein BGW36DRAFT_426515 [Talaromyces proteolyticus]|uniref:Swi5-dependent recombination DNA repair protein 1 n=1 Tax=Talaromyces proteolyticus TaxID=1131652 RepID=A0AAD4KRI5_9EURO|nr:uncharacterized protein BGW36DRAFT_426515 [Talaromyces proteolyticus]KAH8698825.1 hypothetical protein BGW36DRAFT_426515 [Talaromyces proteolyticus]
MDDKHPSIKRRRLNEAASALSRPFKSPLRRDNQQQSGSPANKTEENNTVTEGQGKRAPTTTNPARSSLPKPFLPSTTDKPSHDSHLASSIPRHQRPTTNPDPETSALQKEQKSLLSRLSSLRSQLDTAQQALRIESSSRDAELHVLIQKWKKVSQNVADELFVSARDRIERMGGMQAWREREREKKMQMRWDDEEAAEFKDQDGMKGAITPSTDKDEQEVFTMDKMLASLNIDLNIIGFDKDGQRWVD